VLPEDFEMPPGGLGIRWPDKPLEQEFRLHNFKLNAALAFARANKLDRVVIDSPNARFGIATTGKSYLDVMQALAELGIDAAYAAEIGIRVYKIGMSWPLERDGVRRFAEGLEEILVVEEKRAVIENQIKEQLYNCRADVRPRVVGKVDENGVQMQSSTGELSPTQVAKAIAARIAKFHASQRLRERVALLEAKERRLATLDPAIERTPHFCSGCPHNTSTRVPEGSRAVAGIGCHFMALWMDRDTETFTQMGGEGVPWIGQAPFSEDKHIFANLGDGTYFHSGFLAIRQAVAAGVNITYKLLYNDAVAMTGGQPLDGTLTVAQIAQELKAEGVRRVVVVSDEPDKHALGAGFPTGTTIHHREELDAVQRDLREIEGVTVLIYEQTCATEKRRRRKRGKMVDPAKRAFINEAVCEGCGDCSKASNCLSVVPVETEFGRKRQIDQSSCNKDFSCVNGFCPSFVTVHGGQLRKPKTAGAGDAAGNGWAALPEPTLPELTDRPYNVLVTGIGGTGVVTIGALLGMAAHIEGRGVTVLDMTGLAQKGGAVLSHVRIAKRPEDIHAVRIPVDEADALLACDIVVAATPDALSRIASGRTRPVVNTHEAISGAFIQNPDLPFAGADLRNRIADAAGGPGAAEFVEATAIATALLRDSIATNLFMLGYAYQKGLIPISAAAIETAIELNGVAVEFNKQAFLWGRRTAHDRGAVLLAATPRTGVPESRRLSESFDELVGRRVADLTLYQDATYAARYEDLIRRVARAESERARGRSGLAEAVARSLYKLMAYKDEYEVARLYTDGAFLTRLNEQFEGDFTVQFHLAPPLLAERDPTTGHLRKRTYGPWMLKAFGVLAKLRRLRGTKLDVFGYTEERKTERRLIEEYRSLVEELIAKLTPENHGLAVDLAKLPLKIRGFGHVKEANLHDVKAKEAELLQAFRSPPAPALAAE